MKIMVYSVYDSKAGIWGSPNFMLNRGTALRAWSDAANDQQSNIGKHPADYAMFEIGVWDDETGTFTNLETKTSLGVAIEFIKRVTPEQMLEKIKQMPQEAQQ